MPLILNNLSTYLQLLVLDLLRLWIMYETFFEHIFVTIYSFLIHSIIVHHTRYTFLFYVKYKIQFIRSDKSNDFYFSFAKVEFKPFASNTFTLGTLTNIHYLFCVQQCKNATVANHVNAQWFKGVMYFFVIFALLYPLVYKILSQKYLEISTPNSIS